MYFTLGTAAKHAGLSKGTISKAISSGKLTAQKSEDTGSYKIDPAELQRYMDAVSVQRATVEKPVSLEDEERTATHSNTKETLSETVYERRLKEVQERAELQARTKLAEERLSDLKAQLEEMREQRDQWREQAQRLALPAPAAATPQPAPQPERRGLFGWLKRAG